MLVVSPCLIHRRYLCMNEMIEMNEMFIELKVDTVIEISFKSATSKFGFGVRVNRYTANEPMLNVWLL